MDQPTIIVRNAENNQDSSNSSSSVLVGVWAEAPAPGIADQAYFCIHVAAVNTGNTNEDATFTVASPWFAGAKAALLSSVLFQVSLHRQLSTIVPGGDQTARSFTDSIGPGQATVYRLGCAVQPAPLVAEMLSPPPPFQDLQNPSFEEFVLAGDVASWGLSKDYPYLRDGRSRVAADLSTAQHGRRALRVTVPSTSWLLVPLSIPSKAAIPGVSGLYLPASRHVKVSLWVRTPAAALKVQLFAAIWNATDITGMTTQRVFTSDIHVNQTWQQIRAVGESGPKASCLNLRTSGPGLLYVDNVVVRVKTDDGEVDASSLTTSSSPYLISLPVAATWSKMFTIISGCFMV